MKPVRVITSLNFGIYPGHCLFSCGYTYEGIYRHFKKTNQEWLGAIESKAEDIRLNKNMASKVVMENLKTGETKTFFFIVFHECFDFTDYFYAKLAHEVLHILQFYTPDVFDRNREIEAEAYLHTHLMMQALRNVMTQKKE